MTYEITDERGGDEDLDKLPVGTFFVTDGSRLHVRIPKTSEGDCLSLVDGAHAKAPFIWHSDRCSGFQVVRVRISIKKDD